MNPDLLVHGINNKDIQAWEELYASYYASLCSYCNGIVHDRDVAKDLVQEVLVAVWRSAKVFRSARELTLYLYRACYNNALVNLRNTSIHKSHIQKMEAESLEDPDKLFAITVQEELIRQLYVHIQKLPEGSRQIMELSIRGLSGPEIAEKLGVSINTVKTQKSRGYKYLRKKLEGSVLIFLL